MPDDPTIVLAIDIAAPRRVVWRCLTETSCIRAWWNPGVSLAPHVGGHFSEPWRDGEGREMMTSGEVVQIAEPELLVLSWADAGWDVETTVCLQLTEQDGMSRLQLIHAGWVRFPEGERSGLVADHTAGWQRHLAALKAYAETRNRTAARS